MRLTTLAVLLAAATALGLGKTVSVGMISAGRWLQAILHGAWLVRSTEKRRRCTDGAARIDGLLALGLSHINWFELMPLVDLLA